MRLEGLSASGGDKQASIVILLGIYSIDDAAGGIKVYI